MRKRITRSPRSKQWGSALVRCSQSSLRLDLSLLLPILFLLGSFNPLNRDGSPPPAGSHVAFAGGDYKIDFSAANAALYERIPASTLEIPADIPVGRADDPLEKAADNTSVESLAPGALGLGQIVAFEFRIEVGSGAPANDCITVTALWPTQTNNGGAFGYDPNYGLLAAFVDYGDPSSVEIDADATVVSVTDNNAVYPNDILGTFQVCGLDPGEKIVVEAWVVLQDAIAPGTGGNVQAELTNAVTSGVSESGDKINIGKQTIPLLKLNEFFTNEVDLSITKVDAPDPLFPGDQLTYTIVVTNNSTDVVANDVVVTDNLDPNTTFVSASTGCSSDGAGTVTCDLGFIDPEGSKTIEIVVTVNADAPVNNAPGEDPLNGECADVAAYDLCNTATVSSLTDETDPSNNSASEPTNVKSLICGDCEITQISPAPGTNCPDEEYAFQATVTGVCDNPQYNWSVTLDGSPVSLTDLNPAPDVFTILPDECGVYGISLSITCEGCVGPTECTFELKIDETEAPTVTDCPDNKEVTGCEAAAIASVTALPLSTAKDPAPISLGQFQAEGGDATDNCGIASIGYQDVVSGACPILVTRTFYIDDICGNQNSSCVQVFTVNPPAVSVSCPANESTETCLTQDAVNTAFNTWLAKFKAEGGCNVVGNFQGTPEAPPACGGSTSVTFIASDDCEQQQSCTRTFTVPNRPDLVVSGPANVTKGTCENPADFASWKAQFAVSGGCGTVVKYYVNDAEVTQTVFNNTAAPSKCGGSVKLKISAADDCSQSGSKEATYAVPNRPDLVVSGPANVTKGTCENPADFAAWKAQFAVSGGCGTVVKYYVNDAEVTQTVFNNTGAPSKCGGSVKLKISAADDCSQSGSKEATYAVPNRPDLVVSGPANVTKGTCEDPADFAAWKAQFAVSGGCGTVVKYYVNDAEVTQTVFNNTGAPSKCGGSVKLKISAADDCSQSGSKEATYAVPNRPDLVVSGPANVTKGTCEDPADFAAWKAQFAVSGGCGTVVKYYVNDAEVTQTVFNNTGAPSKCGGSVKLKIAAADDCSQSGSKEATYAVPNRPDLVVSGPANVTKGTCENPADFASWKAQFAVSGGCGTVVKYYVNDAEVTQTVFNNTGAPSKCGGSVKLKISAADDCSQSGSKEATYAVPNRPDLVVSGPANVTKGTCENPADFASWKAQFAVSGGCGTVVKYYVNDAEVTQTVFNNTGAPSKCGGSVKLKISAADDCSQSGSKEATYAVPNRPDLVVSGPANVTKGTCENPADFASWKAQFAVSGGCGTVVKYYVNDAEVTQTVFNNTGAPSKCGGSVKLKISAADDCSQSGSKEATYAVPNRPDLVVSGPANVTKGTCENPADFAAWKAQFAVSGGCGTVVKYYVNDAEVTQTVFNNTAAPSKCGGSVKLKISAADDCSQSGSKEATYAVPNRPDLVVSGPANVTKGTCENPADFASWKAQFAVSGGCGTVVKYYVNDAEVTQTVFNNTAAPSKCGGSVKLKISAADDCSQSGSKEATYAVPNRPDLVVSGPANVTKGTCENPADFAAWKAQFAVSGGCGTVVKYYVNDAEVTQTVFNNTGAPSKCGGSVKLKISAADDCSQSGSKEATYAVPNRPDLVVSGPANVTKGTCENPADFAAWKAQFAVSGGCGTVVKYYVNDAEVTQTVFNNTGAPSKCGGSVKLKIAAADDCSQSGSKEATYAVPNRPDLVVSGPANVTKGTCENPADFAAWKAQFTASGGCGTVVKYYVNDAEVTQTVFNNTAAPSKCGGSVKLKISAADDCSQSGSKEATYAVPNRPDLVVSGPANVTKGTCENPADFAAWKAQFAVSGGCGTVVKYYVNDAEVTQTVFNNTGAPSKCGGSVKLKISAADDCSQSGSKEATYAVPNRPDLVVSGPANVTKGTCENPADFAAWKAQFAVSGGCGTVVKYYVNDAEVTQTVFNNTAAPSKCGGSVKLKISAADDCSQSGSKEATYAVPNRPDLVVSGPANVTKGTCENPADFAAWKAQFAVSGGCGTVVKYYVNDAEVTQTVFNNTGAPSKCGGSVKLKISAADDCSQSGSKEATYAVPIAPKPGISCPDNKTIDPCLTQEEVNKAFADWLALFQVSNGCPGTTGRFDGEPKAPDKCGGTTEVTYRAIDGSGCYADMTCTKTFTVPPQPAIELSCPAPLVLECGDKDTKAKIEAWLESVVVTKGCNVKLTNDYEEGSLSDGCGLTGSQTVTFSAADDCGNTKSCASQIIIEDTTAPTCDAPPTYDGITVFCGARFEVPNLVPLVTAGDLCSAPEEITVTQNPAAGTFVVMPLDGQVITFTVTDACGNPTTCTTLITCRSELPEEGLCTYTPGFWANHNEIDKKKPWQPSVESLLMEVGTIDIGPWKLDRFCIDILLPGAPHSNKQPNLNNLCGLGIKEKTDVNAMLSHTIALTLNLMNSPTLGNVPLALIQQHCERLKIPSGLPAGATVLDLLKLANSKIPGFDSKVNDALTAINECFGYQCEEDDSKPGKDSKTNPPKKGNLSAAPGLGVTLAPNPATETLRVSFYAEQAEVGDIQVFSVFGQLLKTIRLESTAGYNEVNLELYDLSAGSYYLVVRLGGQREMKPFVRLER